MVTTRIMGRIGDSGGPGVIVAVTIYTGICGTISSIVGGWVLWTIRGSRLVVPVIVARHTVTWIARCADIDSSGTRLGARVVEGVGGSRIREVSGFSISESREVTIGGRCAITLS